MSWRCDIRNGDVAPAVPPRHSSGKVASDCARVADQRRGELLPLSAATSASSGRPRTSRARPSSATFFGTAHRARRAPRERRRRARPPPGNFASISVAALSPDSSADDALAPDRPRRAVRRRGTRDSAMPDCSDARRHPRRNRRAELRVGRNADVLADADRARGSARSACLRPSASPRPGNTTCPCSRWSRRLVGQPHRRRIEHFARCRDWTTSTSRTTAAGRRVARHAPIGLPALGQLDLDAGQKAAAAAGARRAGPAISRTRAAAASTQGVPPCLRLPPTSAGASQTRQKRRCTSAMCRSSAHSGSCLMSSSLSASILCQDWLNPQFNSCDVVALPDSNRPLHRRAAPGVSLTA